MFFLYASARNIAVSFGTSKGYSAFFSARSFWVKSALQ